MLTIEIVNDGTGLHHDANYTYHVMVNGRVVGFGEVHGHNRDDGWPKLIRMLSEAECQKNLDIIKMVR